MTRKEILLDVAERCGIKIDGKEAVEFDRDEMANFKKWLFEELKNAGQVPCKDAKYKKDLNELKKQILKEGNTSVSKRDLLERFCEMDEEYNGEPWNLLQIIANINVLIGEEPCEDAVSRQAVSDFLGNHAKDYEDTKIRMAFMAASSLVKNADNVPSATPTRKKGKWIDTGEISTNRKGQIVHEVICSECNGISYFRGIGGKYIGANFCPCCKTEMESEE